MDNQTMLDPGLRKALEGLKKHQGQKESAAVAAEMLKGKILAPAVWDKAPAPDGHGQLVFPPDTNISLMVMERQDKKNFFPFFTSKETLEKWIPKEQCLVLTFDQFMPFLKMAGGEVDGVILDPEDLDITLDTSFLQQLEKIRLRGLSANRIVKGDKVTVKDPGEEGKYLGNVLAKTAESMPEVRSIVLKERLMPDNSQHWFIIVDADSEDPVLFSKLSAEGSRLAGGRDMEFMFGSTELGKKIMHDSMPVYTREKA